MEFQKTNNEARLPIHLEITNVKPATKTNSVITMLNCIWGLSFGKINLIAKTLETPIKGDIEYDGNNFWITEFSGQRKSISGSIYSQTTSVTVVNTVAETSLLTNTTKLPSDFFVAGRTLYIKLRGIHSAATNPTIRIKVKLNNTVVLDTTAIFTRNGTNNYFDIDGAIDCRSIGINGTLMSQGAYFESGNGLNHFPMVNTSTVAINTTIPQVFDITAQWGTQSSSNTITATNGFINVIQ